MQVFVLLAALFVLKANGGKVGEPTKMELSTNSTNNNDPNPQVKEYIHKSLQSLRMELMNREEHLMDQIKAESEVLRRQILDESYYRITKEISAAGSSLAAREDRLRDKISAVKNDMKAATKQIKGELGRIWREMLKLRKNPAESESDSESV